MPCRAWRSFAGPVRQLAHEKRSAIRLRGHHSPVIVKCTTTRHNSNTSTVQRTWSTSLAKDLAEAITTTGPISVASFMRQCLTSAEHGYYAGSDKSAASPIGRTGDFVTSPEISQIFGELVGVWFVAEWMSQGRASSGVEIIELGPGRGTLMDDLLRTVAQFKPMASAIERVWLVESSPVLREMQRRLLCGEDSTMEEIEHGFKSQSKRLPGVEVHWIEDLSLKPKAIESPQIPFLVAHEFFDALPIYSFQSAPVSNFHRAPSLTTSTTPTRPPPRSNEWRELLVNVAAPPSIINPPKTPPPEFELTLSAQPTRHARVLPQTSSRYAALLDKPGNTIEICPSAQIIAGLIAQGIGGANPKPAPQSALHEYTTTTTTEPTQPTTPQPPNPPAGAALLVDYGPPSTIPISTLRGIAAHKLTSPFNAPGRTDLSADVDFTALADAALAASPGVEVHGPVSQGDWLGAMGGAERMEMLLKGAGEEEVRERIRTGWARLTDRGPDGMGKVYQVMAVVPVGSGRRPVGFGGDVGG